MLLLAITLRILLLHTRGRVWSPNAGEYRFRGVWEELSGIRRTSTSRNLWTEDDS